MYWKYHLKGKPSPNFFSEEFKSLVQSMLLYNPEERLTIDQIKNHEWFNGTTSTHAEIKFEFERRKAVNDDEAERENAIKR